MRALRRFVVFRLLFNPNITCLHCETEQINCASYRHCWWTMQDINLLITFSDGCLGSHNDEERSEMRYVMRIAESSESSKF